MRPRIPRSLRSRLLLLFAALAVGPLATVGIFDYVRSARLVDGLVISQTDTVAHRAAKAVADRYAIVASDILLLTENTEVQRLLGELARGDSGGSEARARPPTTTCTPSGASPRTPIHRSTARFVGTDPLARGRRLGARSRRPGRVRHHGANA